MLSRWIGGVFLLLASLIYLGQHNLSAIGFGLSAFILLPPLSNIPSKLLKKPLSRGIKIILLIIFLTIGFKYVPQSEIKNTITDSLDQPKATATIKQTQKSPIPTPTPIFYKVTSVVDGDTIKVSIDGKIESIRLIGIDTPETVDPRKPVQCFGLEASNKAKEVLTNKKVLLESDSTQDDRDKYNRLLRYVFLEDGSNFNKMMIAEGYAHEYTYNSPYKYQAEFKQAEKEARENKKGLWADNVCVTPTPTYKPIPTSTYKPTSTPVPAVQGIYVPPATKVPQTQTNQTGSYSCDCSKLCSQMASCEEAYYQLNQCGCSKRDGDSDGVPCESICP